MSTDVMSGPFRYIAQIAQLFRKAEQDLKVLEGILSSLHKEIGPRFCNWKRGEESASEDGSSANKKLSCGTGSHVSSRGVHKMCISNKFQNPRLINKIQSFPEATKNMEEIVSREPPHWFVRVFEFYFSITHAYSVLRKHLKSVCKEYAREMITCIKFYKQNATNSPERMEKDVEKVIQSMQRNYDKKIESLTSMIRLCEQQRMAISENKMKLLSEIEVNTVEIICLKETTLKILPSITAEEEMYESTRKKDDETRKILKTMQDHFNKMKRAKLKLTKHNNRAVASRNSLVRELNKTITRISKVVDAAKIEAGKLQLKELNERGNNLVLITKMRNYNSKMEMLDKKHAELQLKLHEALENICDLQEEIASVEEEEKKVLFELQSACVTSHKNRTELKQLLASTIKRLQAILYNAKMKKEALIQPMKQRVIDAKENVQNLHNEVDDLEEEIQRLYDHLDETLDQTDRLKTILENTESQFQELDMTILMIENGFKRFVHNKMSYLDNIDLSDPESRELLEEMVLVGEMQSTKEMVAIDLSIQETNELVCELGRKNNWLQQYVQVQRRKLHCDQNSVIALAHIYISIAMLPLPDAATEIIPSVSVLDDTSMSAGMPDILMTGQCCSIDSSLRHVHPDDVSSKCSSKCSRRKSKRWAKFEHTLRKNLVEELRRMMSME